MAVYKCSVCGYMYDEEAEGKPFEELRLCPVCKQTADDFNRLEEPEKAETAVTFQLRESASVPTVYALHRARKYLDSILSDISLVITGGLRVSSDVAKAIAMGALADLCTVNRDIWEFTDIPHA